MERKGRRKKTRSSSNHARFVCMVVIFKQEKHEARWRRWNKIRTECKSSVWRVENTRRASEVKLNEWFESWMSEIVWKVWRCTTDRFGLKRSKTQVVGESEHEWLQVKVAHVNPLDVAQDIGGLRSASRLTPDSKEITLKWKARQSEHESIDGATIDGKGENEGEWWGWTCLDGESSGDCSLAPASSSDSYSKFVRLLLDSIELSISHVKTRKSKLSPKPAAHFVARIRTKQATETNASDTTKWIEQINRLVFNSRTSLLIVFGRLNSVWFRLANTTSAIYFASHSLHVFFVAFQSTCCSRCFLTLQSSFKFVHLHRSLVTTNNRKAIRGTWLESIVQASLGLRSKFIRLKHVVQTSGASSPHLLRIHQSSAVVLYFHFSFQGLPVTFGSQDFRSIRMVRLRHSGPGKLFLSLLHISHLFQSTIRFSSWFVLSQSNYLPNRSPRSLFGYAISYEFVHSANKAFLLIDLFLFHFILLLFLFFAHILRSSFSFLFVLCICPTTSSVVTEIALNLVSL